MASVGGGGSSQDNSQLNRQLTNQSLNKNNQDSKDKLAQEIAQDAAKEAKAAGKIDKKISDIESGDKKDKNSGQTGVEPAIDSASSQISQTVDDKNIDTSKIDDSSGTQSGSIASSVMAGEEGSATSEVKAKLQANDSHTFSELLVAAHAEDSTLIHQTVDGASRGHIHTDEFQSIGGGNDPQPSQANAAKIAATKSDMNKDIGTLASAGKSLNTTTKNYEKACSQYGVNSSQAQTIKGQMVRTAELMHTLSQSLATDQTKLQAYGGDPTGTMNQKTGKSLAAANLSIMHADSTLGKEESDAPMTDQDFFGSYNNQALGRCSASIAVMTAMMHMSDVTNAVTQQQTSVENGMQKMQTNLNNALQKQLQAENPILKHLAKLGKEEASASQVSTGLFSLIGNSFEGGALGWIVPAAEHKNVGDSYKKAWKGIGETLGFVPPAANVEGEIVATNGRLTQLNSETQVATQKVSNLTTSVNAQGRSASASAQSVQSLNQMMTSLVKMWADALNQAISSGGSG